MTKVGAERHGWLPNDGSSRAVLEGSSQCGASSSATQSSAVQGCQLPGAPDCVKKICPDALRDWVDRLHHRAIQGLANGSFSTLLKWGGKGSNLGRASRGK